MRVAYCHWIRFDVIHQHPYSRWRLKIGRIYAPYNGVLEGMEYQRKLAMVVLFNSVQHESVSPQAYTNAGGKEAPCCKPWYCKRIDYCVVGARARLPRMSGKIIWQSLKSNLIHFRTLKLRISRLSLQSASSLRLLLPLLQLLLLSSLSNNFHSFLSD